MVNSDKMIGEIMLVVCSHRLFTKLYLQNVRAYGSYDNYDVGATILQLHHV